MVPGLDAERDLRREEEQCAEQREELVPARIEQITEATQARDLTRGRQALGAYRLAQAHEPLRSEGLFPFQLLEEIGEEVEIGPGPLHALDALAYPTAASPGPAALHEETRHEGQGARAESPGSRGRKGKHWEGESQRTFPATRALAG